MQSIKDIVAETIDVHGPLPTAQIEKGLQRAAIQHIEAADDDQGPVCGVGVCHLISLLREILLYRQKYGLIEPIDPDDEEKWEEAGDDRIMNLWEGLDEKTKQ